MRGGGEVVDNKPAGGGVVDDEQRDEPQDVPRDAVLLTTSGATSRVTSRATCRGTRMHGRGEVVDDEPARGGVVNDERRDGPRDEPRNVPKQLDAQRRKIDSTLTGARRLASMDLGESTSRLILLTRVLRIRPVVKSPLPGAPAVGVLDRQTYQGSTRGSRLCGGDRDRETENSKVCIRTRDTRFIQVRVAKVANPTSCLEIKYGALRLVLGCSGPG
jgi:hypothetical protein